MTHVDWDRVYAAMRNDPDVCKTVWDRVMKVVQDEFLQ